MRKEKLTDKTQVEPFRSGFTLVEMLIVIMIIGIMAGIALSALQGAQSSASAARTRATIGKLNNFIMTRYASYQTRRVDVDTSGKGSKAAASLRLYALRRLQRAELPDCWADVTSGGTNAISQMIRSRYKGDGGGSCVDSELLYLTVMGMPGADETFSESEVGDTDGNGNKEFLDGWGKPIRFIRWPVGYTSNYNCFSDLQTGNAQQQHDPFDPLNVEPEAYAVFPLIYSAGSDGQFELRVDNLGGGGVGWSDLCSQEQGIMVGAPARVDSETNQLINGRGRHYDNITNHDARSR